MTDCVIWRGQRYGQYGGLSLGDGRRREAHRVFYVLYNGPIPRGHLVHHTCEEKLCVNPRHLVTMTRAEHQLLHGNMAKAGAARRAQQLAATTCKRGHPWPEGSRLCLTCIRDRRSARAAA